MSRRRRLDRGGVVEAAARLVDQEGVDALSLARLSRELGVQPPSLYNHVEGLGGLMRELALLNLRQMARALTAAAIGKAGPEAVMAVAQAYRDYIKAHPGVYMAGLRYAAGQPGDQELHDLEQQVVDVALAVVASFGLTGDDALHAVRGLRSVVHGFATLEIAGGFGLSLDCDESFRRLVQIFYRGLENTVEEGHPLSAR